MKTLDTERREPRGPSFRLPQDFRKDISLQSKKTNLSRINVRVPVESSSSEHHFSGGAAVGLVDTRFGKILSRE